MTRLTVLHPITRLIVGGAQENTILTAALLDRSKYEVEILSGPETGSEGSLEDEVRSRGIALTTVPELVREISPTKDLRATWSLYRAFKARNAAIVHTHSSKAGLVGRLAARLAGTPIIVHTVHGWSFNEHMSKSRRRTYVALERFAASFTDAIVVVTERDMEKGLREGIGRRDRYVLIRSGIDLEDFDPGRVDRATAREHLGIPVESPVVGGVARFTPQKNPLDWIRVAGLVARRVPECRFVLVGDGPLRPDVEALASHEGLDGRLILTGIRRDVPAVMGAMDVVLLTSLWEGLPRILPQAHAMGVPGVAFRVDGTIDAISPGETGYLVEPHELEEMASRCVELLRDPVRRREMGDEARSRAIREFDVREMVARIAALYERLLATKRDREKGRPATPSA